MPTSFGGRSIYTSWGVTLFCPTCAEQAEPFEYLRGYPSQAGVGTGSHSRTGGWQLIDMTVARFFI
jgi:hypothetical protein